MLRRVPQDQLTDRKNKKNNINNNTSVGAMSNDPADVRANARAEMGLSREVEQVRARESDPSRGGSRGYDIHDREWMLEHFALLVHHKHKENGTHQQQQQFFFFRPRRVVVVFRSVLKAFVNQNNIN
jgi:hypothetical protein